MQPVCAKWSRLPKKGETRHPQRLPAERNAQQQRMRQQRQQ
jgi:hypothetical protein